MANYNFRKDLALSEISQAEVAELLEQKYKAEILEYNRTYRYDILTKINEKEYKFEVKEDFICEKSNNVGLEYECRGKLSGINTTEADFYVYKLHTNHGIEFIMHNTNALKKMIEEKKYFRIVNGGDKGSNSMNYLFKYKEFVKTGLVLTLTK